METGNFRFVGRHETIEETDLVRPLFFWRDLGGFGPGPDPHEEDHRGKQWRPVGNVIPAWIGKSLYDLYEFRVECATERDNDSSYIPGYEPEYEIIRQL
jgi:hypothetical protein